MFYSQKFDNIDSIRHYARREIWIFKIYYLKKKNIGILSINRPEALNALNSQVLDELDQAMTL